MWLYPICLGSAGNSPQAAFGPGYSHPDLITPSRGGQWDQTSRGCWLTQAEGHEKFHQGFDQTKQLGGCVSPTPWLRKDSFPKRKYYTCLGFVQRWKIPTTRSLLAPTCLYSRGCWVTAAQPRNLRQKRRVSHAPGLGPVLRAAGSQAREDSEHAKFKVNSRETSEATSCCWELPCHFLLFVPILHGQLLAGWRVLYTAAPQDWSADRVRNSKAPGWLLHKDLATRERERAPPTLRSHQTP